MPGGNEQNINQGFSGGIAQPANSARNSSFGASQPQDAGYQSQASGVQGAGEKFSPAPNQNGSVDGISGNANGVGGTNLGPNQIAPNLAKETDYFTDQSAGAANTGLPQGASQEMQYPGMNETHESTFSPKLLVIIVVVVLALGGALGGIIYFFSSRKMPATTEEIDLSNGDNSSIEDTTEASLNTGEGSGGTDLVAPDTNATSDTNQNTASDTNQNADSSANQGAVSSSENNISTPTAEAPQPAPQTPDSTGAVKGSG